MALTSNEADHPQVLIARNARASVATYVDVNPNVGPGVPILLTNAAAVFASIRNLFLCPAGGRGRIFQEDYWSGVYSLLQEPFDGITANALSIAIFQALRVWEKRVTVRSSDVGVVAVPSLPGYQVTLTITVNGKAETQTFNLITSG